MAPQPHGLILRAINAGCGSLLGFESRPLFVVFVARKSVSKGKFTQSVILQELKEDTLPAPGQLTIRNPLVNRWVVRVTVTLTPLYQEMWHARL
jgi:hypothetical protein